MYYPESFKKEVLDVFGDDNERINKCLNSGSEFLGRILCDSGMDISSKDFVNAYESSNPNDMEKLYKQAKRSVAIKDLYAEWSQLSRTQTKPR